jgi:hypothetical protein
LLGLANSLVRLWAFLSHAATACRRGRANASWACNRLEANMTPETKDDLLHAMTNFYEAMRGSLDGAELDQSERKAIVDFVQAVHDAATELKRKLGMQH